MCGRFVGSFNIDDLLEELASWASHAGLVLSQPDSNERIIDNFNVAPTTMIPIVRVKDGQLVQGVARWGLVPTWAREVPSSRPLVNARSETIHEKPSFRDLLARNRCIVPMNGFYEWDRSDPRRTRPYYVPRKDGRLLMCLALWSHPTALGGIDSVAILTAQSSDDLRGIHDRAPVQVGAPAAIEWLTDDDHPLSCLAAPNPRLAPYPVSSDVNSIRNNGSNLIAPFAEQENSNGPLFD